MAPSLADSKGLSIEGFTGYRNFQSPTKSIHLFKGAIQLDLGQYWPSWQENKGSRLIKQSTFLKAAWILTLRCFRPEEVISISYDEGLVPRPHSPIGFTERVEPEWDVWSLLERLERKELGEVTGSGAVCTAALRYITESHEPFTSLTSLSGKLEVSPPL